MKIKYLIWSFFIALCLWQGISCAFTKYKKINHQYTDKIEYGLFIECYKPYEGGVFGGDLRSYYLTDSLEFNTFIDSEDDNEYLSFECFGNNLVVKKYQSKGYISNDTLPQLIDSTIYNIAQLKTHRF